MEPRRLGERDGGQLGHVVRLLEDGKRPANKSKTPISREQ